MRVLPEGWEKSNLNEFTSLVMGQSPSSDTYNTEGSGLPFFQGKAEFTETCPKAVKYCSSPTRVAEAGATLMSVRAPVGPSNLASEQCCIGRGLAAIHPLDEVNPFFIFYFIRSIENDLKHAGTGSTFQAINKSFVEDIEIFVPPLSEQQRIVTKIEELFSELDKGIEALKTAQAQLKVYRQALLKHAFEGKLTADWREANKDKLESADKLLARIKTEREAHYQQQLDDWKQAVKDWETNGKEGKKPTKPKKVKMLPDLDEEVLSNLPNPPVQWAYVKWEDILDYDEGAFRRGPFGSTLKKAFFVKEGYKVYEQYCPINDDCSFERYYITPEKYAELKAFWVKSGDFLISCSGVTLGRITQVPSGYKEGVINQAILRIRLNQSYYCSDFFKDLFRSSEFQKKFFDKSTGSAIPNVKGVKELKVIPVPLCSLDEQLEITARLNAKLSVLDRMEADIETQLKKSEALRQSILKKAFSGQLVPQDPTDEPASKLLERIKAEKAEAAALKKPKRKKAS